MDIEFLTLEIDIGSKELYLWGFSWQNFIRYRASTKQIPSHVS